MTDPPATAARTEFNPIYSQRSEREDLPPRSYAHALVTKWFSANDIPAAAKSVLMNHNQFRGAELIDGFFERQVDLQRPSQTDLLAIINVGSRVAVTAVEGKVDEPSWNWSGIG